MSERRKKLKEFLRNKLDVYPDNYINLSDEEIKSDSANYTYAMITGDGNIQWYKVKYPAKFLIYVGIARQNRVERPLLFCWNIGDDKDDKDVINLKTAKYFIKDVFKLLEEELPKDYERIPDVKNNFDPFDHTFKKENDWEAAIHLDFNKFELGL